jgi:hypothetical protein
MLTALEIAGATALLIAAIPMIEPYVVDREEPRRWRFTAGFVHLEVFDFARLGGW